MFLTRDPFPCPELPRRFRPSSKTLRDQRRDGGASPTNLLQPPRRPVPRWVFQPLGVPCPLPGRSSRVLPVKLGSTPDTHPLSPHSGRSYTHAAGSSVGRAIGFPKGSLRARLLARSRADSAWLPSLDGARVRVPPRCIPSLFTPWDGGGTGRHTLRLPVDLSFPTPCLPFRWAEAGRLSGRCAVRHAGSSPARPPA